MIQDSGERQEFDTGAVRDVTEGKGRCDLMPLGVIGELLHDGVLTDIEYYIRTGQMDFLKNALDDFGEYKGECDMYEIFLDVSHHYEEGAHKYKERNWEQGIPLHSFIDSAVRHYLKFQLGYHDERHDRAFVWNLLGALWTQKNKPEMIDLPFGEKEDKQCK